MGKFFSQFIWLRQFSQFFSSHPQFKPIFFSKIIWYQRFFSSALDDFLAKLWRKQNKKIPVNFFQLIPFFRLTRNKLKIAETLFSSVVFCFCQLDLSEVHNKIFFLINHLKNRFLLKLNNNFVDVWKCGTWTSWTKQALLASCGCPD